MFIFFEIRTVRHTLQSLKATCLLWVKTSLELVWLENHEPFVAVQELYFRYEGFCTCFCGWIDHNIFARYLVCSIKMLVCHPKT